MNTAIRTTKAHSARFVAPRAAHGGRGTASGTFTLEADLRERLRAAERRAEAAERKATVLERELEIQGRSL